MKKYNLYAPGDLVYAISFNNGEDESPKDHIDKVDSYDLNYARIYKVEIDSVTIHSDGIEYWVRDPSTLVDWGDCIKETQVSDNYNDLLDVLIKRWRLK